MQTGKNLTATAQGASKSRVNRAKTVSESKSFLSKGTYINLKGRLNKAERELAEIKASQTLHTYRVKLQSHYYYPDGDKTSCRYTLDKEYQAVSRAEALGMASIEMGQIVPNYSIAPISFGGVKICTQIK